MVELLMSLPTWFRGLIILIGVVSVLNILEIIVKSFNTNGIQVTEEDFNKMCTQLNRVDTDLKEHIKYDH